jgi:hypothetical protein
VPEFLAPRIFLKFTATMQATDAVTGSPSA